MKSKCRCVTVDALLRRLFYRYAIYVNRYRWLFLIVPVIVTAIGTTGFYFIKEQTRNQTNYVYTPLNSTSNYEKAVLNEHWPLIQNRYYPGKFYQMKYRVEVMVQAKDDGNLLREEVLNATVELNRIISKDFAVRSYDGLINITYPAVCLTWNGECYENGQLELLQKAREIEKYVPVTFPISRKNDAPFYLGSSIGGVRYAPENSTGRFDFAHTLRMTYAMVEAPAAYKVYSRQWMFGLERFVRNYESPYLKLAINHAESLDQGLEENAKRLVPKFSITFMVLALFCTLCSFVLLDGEEMPESDEHKKRGCFDVKRAATIDWVRSKPGLAVVGVLSSCMAIATAIGFMLLIGSDFNSVVCVMPFLVLSIGVNDMCIMTTAWHRTPITAPVEERLAETMSDAAVAITITSFTDVISFAIGSWNSLPAVIMFCSYTSLALFVEYVYQITFFAAAFAFYGRAEAGGRHCLALCANALSADKKDLNWIQRNFLRGTIAPLSPSLEKPPISETPNLSSLCSQTTKPLPPAQHQPEKETPIMRFFRTKYAPAILHPVGRAVVIIAYAAYIGFAFWGCTKIKEGLQFSNLVHREHYMIHYIHMLPDFWHEGMQAQVVVNNPPNLTLSKQRAALLDMVHSFENTEHTMASNATMFFLYEYLNYLDQLNVALEDTEDFWYVKLKRWMKHTGSSASWETDLHWSKDDEYRLLAFRFQIGLRNFATGDQHRQAATFLRQLASEYPEYNITTYHEYWPFVDQYMVIRPTMIQDNTIAIFAMILIAAIFIPNFACGVFITLSMLSINISVYGYMTWWGVNLDCVSMITLVMALGFAIDYSAHICYAYVSAQGMPTRKRTIAALETLGWPVFQGALTTIVGTFVLASVDAYLVQTFFKTVFLTILFGLLHSVVFLPVALSLLLPENGIRVREWSTALFAKLGLRSNVVGSTAVKC